LAHAFRSHHPQHATDPRWTTVLEHVPRVFASIKRDSVKSAANGFHGQLRIALSDGITPSRLPALLARCREEEPEVEIRLFEVPLAQQIKGLHDDLYDVVFRWQMMWAMASWSLLRGKMN
jgi:DNA-binding transcriptional LysR family regulator